MWALATLPFANKAFHIDDDAYLGMARQIAADPWRPYSFPWHTAVGYETGWLINPTREHLAEAMADVLRLRNSLRGMGLQARRRAEIMFDGRKNDKRIVDLLISLSGAS